MQRKTNDYKKMIVKAGLVAKWMEYLQHVEATHGAQIFFDSLLNKQDGRLFGNLTSKSLKDANVTVKSSLSDFYPDQKKFNANGDELPNQIDVLGKEISDAIIEDVNSGVNVNAIGASIADALDKLPAFQDFIARISEGHDPKPDEPLIRDFILGQAVFFSLLPVLESGIKKLNDEVILPSLKVQAEIRKQIAAENKKDEPDVSLINELKERNQKEDEIQAPAAKIMGQLTTKMAKMKESFSKVGSYHHDQTITRVKTTEGKAAKLGEGLLANWSPAPEKKGQRTPAVARKPEAVKSKPVEPAAPSAVAPATSLRSEKPTTKKSSTSDQSEYNPKVKEKLSGTKGIFSGLKVNKEEREAAKKAEMAAEQRRVAEEQKLKETEARVKAQLAAQEAKAKGLVGEMPDLSTSKKSPGK